MTPSQGSSISTLFTAVAQSWTDEHGPLQYEFSIVQPNGKGIFIIKSLGLNPMASFTLPSLVSGSGAVTLQTTIVNALGGMTLTSTQITLSEPSPSFDVESLFVNQLQQISTQFSNGDFESGLNVMYTILDDVSLNALAMTAQQNLRDGMINVLLSLSESPVINLGSIASQFFAITNLLTQRLSLQITQSVALANAVESVLSARSNASSNSGGGISTDDAQNIINMFSNIYDPHSFEYDMAYIQQAFASTVTMVGKLGCVGLAPEGTPFVVTSPLVSITVTVKNDAMQPITASGASLLIGADLAMTYSAWSCSPVPGDASCSGICVAVADYSEDTSPARFSEPSTRLSTKPMGVRIYNPETLAALSTMESNSVVYMLPINDQSSGHHRRSISSTSYECRTYNQSTFSWNLGGRLIEVR